MKLPTAYLAKQNPLLLAGAAVLVVGGLYYFGRKAAADVTRAAGEGISLVAEYGAGYATGRNAITETATNASGERTTAYQGAGIFGTLGAGVNAILGGVPASVGETLGGWVFDAFGPKGHDV